MKDEILAYDNTLQKWNLNIYIGRKMSQTNKP